MQSGLEDTLSDSSPPLDEPEELGLELAAMVVAACREEAARRRTRRRVVGFGTTALLLAAGGTTAAATGVWTAPWSADPLAVATYTLPSGSVCEDRISDVTTTDPAATKPIRTWLVGELREHPLEEVVDVEAAIPEARSMVQTYTSDGSGRLPAGTYDVGYGTEYYDEDHEYFLAIQVALDAAIAARLAELPGLTSLDFDRDPAEVHCTGPNDHPALPWWVGVE